MTNDATVPDFASMNLEDGAEAVSAAEVESVLTELGVIGSSKPQAAPQTKMGAPRSRVSPPVRVAERAVGAIASAHSSSTSSHDTALGERVMKRLNEYKAAADGARSRGCEDDAKMLQQKYASLEAAIEKLLIDYPKPALSSETGGTSNASLESSFDPLTG